MKKYDEYKDSGVEWIGDVPSRWEENRIKFLFSKSIAGIWGDDEKGDSNDIVCFRVADFDYSHGCLRFDKMTTRNILPKQLKGRILHKGDLMIEKSGGGEATPVGRVVRYNYASAATCSNFMHFVTVKNANSDNFLFYYFYAMYANKINMLFFNQTTGIQNLKIAEYLGQIIYLPPLTDQQIITTYLDKRCSEIDKVISVQQKRIVLLQELKQSIITHAVTKGLNPNVEMKNSGVEWIGEMPKHWGVQPIKYIAKTNSGSTPKNIKGKSYDSSMIKWVRTTDLDDMLVYVYDSSEYLSKTEMDSASCPWLDVNTIVVAMYGGAGTIGKCGILGIKSTINQALCSLEPIGREYYKYLFYNIKALRGYWMKYAASSRKDPNISQDIIRNMRIPIPNLSEQQAIATYLDKKCASINSSISKAQHQVDLLQEYKQSLITEVVTGKRKVC